MQLALSDLIRLADASLTKGDPGKILTGFAALDDAGPDDLSFFGGDARYREAFEHSNAGAVLVPTGFSGDVPGVGAFLEVASPSGVFAAAVRQLHAAQQRRFTPGVHPTAVIAPSATFNPEKVSIKAHAVIESDVVIGDGTEISHGTVVCYDVTIGKDCLFHPNVTVREGSIIGNRVILYSGCVIGSDGFGYEPDAEGRFHKIDQVGIVQLDDDVEIGACSTIDRARIGKTHIGEGTKIDNLVMVAHNCVFGKHCGVAGLAGFPGSVKVGDHVTIGGQVGINGHTKVGDHITLLARTGVTKDLPEPGIYWGTPAVPRSEAVRILTAGNKLPDLLKRVRALEKSLAEYASGGSDS